MRTIPFVEPWIDKKELQLALKPQLVCSLGKTSKLLERYFEKKLKVKRALLVGSCTQALEIALMSLDLKKDDEVICPSYTFVSTVSSIIRLGGKAVFVDIEPNSLGLDPNQIERAINDKTRVVVVVHYGGLSAQIETIRKICHANNLRLIEDNAQGVFVKTDGKYLGTFGDIGCFSFHYTKNITCGEGGLLIIPNDSTLITSCEEIRSFGTDKEAFLRGKVDKYEWQRIGGSYFMTDIQAALLKSQISKYPKILAERKRVYKFYYHKLQPLKKVGIGLSKHPSNSNYHLFWLICRSQKERDDLMEVLRRNGIQASFHFLPLHMSPFVKKNPDRFRVVGDMRITMSVSEKILRLPIFPELTNEEANYVCSKILTFYCQVPTLVYTLSLNGQVKRFVSRG